MSSELDALAAQVQANTDAITEAVAAFGKPADTAALDKVTADLAAANAALASAQAELTTQAATVASLTASLKTSDDALAAALPK